MNKVIKKMWKKAEKYADTNALLTDELEPMTIEHFAELIVGECVKLCEHESNDDEYDQYDMGMSVKAEDIKASIMKTFGVK